MIVSVGVHCEVEFTTLSGSTEAFAFDLVADEVADLKNGFLGETTPLAQAVLGQSEGDTVYYEADDITSVHILRVSPSQRAPDAGVQSRRQETIRKAVQQADLTNAIIFASSFNGKWGDYDPSTLKVDE